MTTYQDATASAKRVALSEYDLGADAAGLGTTVLLEFQAANDRAEALLGQRMDHVSSRQKGGADGEADSYLADLRLTFGLPEGVGPDTYRDVEELTRVYLPIWLAEFASVRSGGTVLRSFRDPSNVGNGTDHGWLAKFVEEDPARLAEFGYEVEQAPPPASGPTSAAPGPADGEPAVVQPDGADLDANTLVTPAPERGFGDVGGMSALKDTLRDRVLAPVREPDRHEAYGIDPVSGVLLHGPPGCGKTHLAGALAGELGHYFLDVTPADLTSKYMGEPAQNVADLFAIARANQPCVLFVDELDALAGRRDSDMDTSERQVVNQLLAELEAVSDEDVVVVGATNLPEDVDPAIRRSGRFDERIEVPPPDDAARREILRVHLRDRPTADALDLEPAVTATAGHAASDLALVVDTAARRALREDQRLSTAHLREAAQSMASSLAAWEEAGRYADSEETGGPRYVG